MAKVALFALYRFIRLLEVSKTFPGDNYYDHKINIADHGETQGFAMGSLHSQRPFRVGNCCNG